MCERKMPHPDIDSQNCHLLSKVREAELYCELCFNLALDDIVVDSAPKGEGYSSVDDTIPMEESLTEYQSAVAILQARLEVARLFYVEHQNALYENALIENQEYVEGD